MDLFYNLYIRTLMLELNYVIYINIMIYLSLVIIIIYILNNHSLINK